MLLALDLDMHAYSDAWNATFASVSISVSGAWDASCVPTYASSACAFAYLIGAGWTTMGFYARSSDWLAPKTLV